MSPARTEAGASTGHEETSETTAGTPLVEELVLAVGVLALAVVITVGALGLDGGAGYQAVGPAAFPTLVGALGLVCGAGLTVAAARRVVLSRRSRPQPTPQVDARADDRADAPTAEDGTDAPGRDDGTDAPGTAWPRVVALAVLLVGYAVTFVPVGFWQVTGIVFTLAARIFGSRRWARDLVVGYVLALVTYLLFDRVLGVGLPDGYIAIAG